MSDLLDLGGSVTKLGLAAADIGIKQHFKTMLSLGEFHFSIDDAAYQSLQRSLSWRWAEQQRFGRVDLLQYTGKAAPTVNLQGEVWTDNRRIATRPEKMFTGLRPVKALAAIGDSATPQLLISGTGDVLGYWVVTEFGDTADRFLLAGVPRHLQFQMTIKFYGDNIYHP